MATISLEGTAVGSVVIEEGDELIPNPDSLDHTSIEELRELAGRTVRLYTC